MNLHDHSRGRAAWQSLLVSHPDLRSTAFTKCETSTDELHIFSFPVFEEISEPRPSARTA